MNIGEFLGKVLSVFVSVGTLLTVTVPALRNKLKEGLFRRENLEDKVQVIHRILEEHVKGDRERKEEIALQREVDLCVLRDLITGIYYRSLPEKKLHSYEWEDASALHDLYCKRGGNSYVHSLYAQMSTEWEIIP